MNSETLVKNAKDFINAPTCYEKGFWGQRMTQAEYDRVLKMYPGNNSYGNQKLIGTDVFPFDCICFLKCLLAGGNVNRRLTYGEMKSNPLGDCTNKAFLDSLYDCVPIDKAKAGYGLATEKHCALSLGNGEWIDCNFDMYGQNGVSIHSTGSGIFTKCGKIPGIIYNEETDEIMDFLKWLREKYRKETGL